MSGRPCPQQQLEKLKFTELKYIYSRLHDEYTGIKLAAIQFGTQRINPNDFGYRHGVFHGYLLINLFNFAL